VARGVERALQELERLGAAQVARAQARHPQVVPDALGPPQALEHLGGVRPPAGDVAGQLLEHRESPLAPPVVDRLRHVGAVAQRHVRHQVGPAQVGEQLLGLGGARDAAAVEERQRPHQVAEIGDDPRLAGLDEEIVPELADVPLEQVRLLLDDAQQGAQRLAEPGVARAVDLAVSWRSSAGFWK